MKAFCRNAMRIGERPELSRSNRVMVYEMPRLFSDLLPESVQERCVILFNVEDGHFLETLWNQLHTVSDMLDQAGVLAFDYYVKNEHGEVVNPNSVVGFRQIFWLIPKPADYIHVFQDGTSFLCRWKPNKTVKQMLDDNGLFKESACVEDQNTAIVNLNSPVGIRRHFSIIDH